MLRSLAFAVLFLGTFVLNLGAQTLKLPGELPRYCPIDTRFIRDSVVWNRTAWQMAEALLEKNLPNEGAACLYGGFERLPGGYVLHIMGLFEPVPISATPDSVHFYCPRDPSWLGTLHTHTDPTRLCEPSDLNFDVLLWEEQALVEFILCADGMLYWQFKDPRWGRQVWREP